MPLPTESSKLESLKGLSWSERVDRMQGSLKSPPDYYRAACTFGGLPGMMFPGK